MHRRRVVMLAILTMLVMLVSLVMPITASADDPLPPPPEPAAAEGVPPSDSTADEPVAPSQDQPAEDPVAPTGESTMEESPSGVEATNAEAQAPLEGSNQEPAPAAEAGTEVTLPGDEATSGPAPAVEEPTLPEILDAAPEGTQVVVLDTSGEQLPLASTEAAEILVGGDPMWCPEGISPGGSGCTSEHHTFSELITDLEDLSETGNGTIYVAYNYVASGADLGGITIDYGTTLLESLIIQGGWDFSSNTVTGTSTIAADMNILDWGGYGVPGSLTLNDLIFTDGGGLNVLGFGDVTTADVTLNNVSVLGSDDDGAQIETTGDITVNDSQFVGNTYDGLYAGAGGDFEVNRSDFSMNGSNGLVAGAEGDLQIMDVTANQNAGLGILAGALGNATLVNVSANGNGQAGAVAGAMENAAFSGIETSENGLAGLAAGAIGDLTLVDVVADGNSLVGVVSLALGDASLSGIDANENDYVGVATISLGDTSLTDVNANENGVGVVAASLGGLPLMDIIDFAFGMLTGNELSEELWLPEEVEDRLIEAEAIPGTTTLSGVTADNNEYAGVVAGAMGDTTLTNVYARNNGYVGGVAVSGANVLVADSEFSGNGVLGLGAVSLLDGDVTVYRIFATGNDGIGVAIGSMTTELFPDPSINPSATGGGQLICSVVTGNSLEGLAAGSNVLISGNDLSENGGGEYQEYLGGIVTEGSAADCTTALRQLSDYMAKRKAQLAAAGSCPDLTLSEGGVTAVLHNLCGHEVGLTSPEPTPALPADANLASHVTIVSEDLPVSGGFITLSFPVPADADPSSLGVLFWDGAQWVKVPGGSVVDGMFVVDVTEDGYHVLVQQ